MAKGGRQPGAGRPKGMTNRPVFRNAVTEAQANRLIAKAIAMADEGNETMLKFCLEQIYGKAVQPIGNDENKTLVVSFDNSFKNGSLSTPSTDSQ